ncbi:MAG: hypothetical protein MJE68_09045 [Proteobacteria bacterium]|nr:hypothetical protein [Pseudomonadota bacterium]
MTELDISEFHTCSNFDTVVLPIIALTYMPQIGSISSLMTFLPTVHALLSVIGNRIEEN